MPSLQSSLTLALTPAALAAALLSPGSAASAPQETVFDPDEFYVEGLSHEGSACPGGSLSFNVAPDASQLTLLIGDFRVDGARTVTCRVELLVHVPSGWTFAPVAAEIEGFARLGKDVAARQSLALAQRSTRRVVLATHDWKGPLAGDYRISEQVTTDQWLPCAGKPANDGVVKLTLLSDAEVGAEVGGAAGSLRGASLDGELRQRLKLAWRRCDPRSGEPVPPQAKR
jgi:hypothetical protein